MRLILASLIMVLMLSACANNDPFYYGNTSHRYYRLVRDRDEHSLKAYKKELEDVFAASQRMNKPVPPGLYCDYALLMLAENRYAEAQRYLMLEKSGFQESARFVDFLIKRYQLGDIK